MKKRLMVGMLVGGLMAAMLPGVASARAEAFPVYATGEIGCDGAEETDNRGGTALLRPVEGGIAFQVVLTNAASDWDYYIEVQEETECINVLGWFDGFTTDKNGHGVFRGMVELEQGTYSLNIDVVSALGVPPDPRHREIGGLGYVEVTVR